MSGIYTAWNYDTFRTITRSTAEMGEQKKNNTKNLQTVPHLCYTTLNCPSARNGAFVVSLCVCVCECVDVIVASFLFAPISFVAVYKRIKPEPSSISLI